MSWPSNPPLEVRPRCTRACASPKEVKRLPVDTPATTGPAQPSKLNKLKDLFVSREGGEFASLITSPAPFLLGFLLYQPARSRFRTRPRHGPAPSSDDHTFPNAAVPCPVCLVECSTLLTTFLTRHHMVLTSSLTFSFPQNLKLERLHSNSWLHLDRRLDGDPSPYLWVVQDKC